VQTAAVLTVKAQLTAAAPAVTSTFTVAPFPSLPAITATVPHPTLPPPATAVSCDKGLFVDDVTYPDDSPVLAGTNFTKTWRLKNIGTCSWTTSYALVFENGAVMNGPAVQALTGNINPAQTADVSVTLTAPAANGTYTGNWGLRNASGVIFTHFYVRIKVDDGSGGPFAVTHVTYVLSTWNDVGHTNCPRVKASITTNRAGTVTYHWVRSDSSASTQTLDFASAGTQTINYDWARGSANAGSPTWVGIYVDNPNHQDFGHLDFDTACTVP
jgi:hypothetical protein